MMHREAGGGRGSRDRGKHWEEGEVRRSQVAAAVAEAAGDEGRGMGRHKEAGEGRRHWKAVGGRRRQVEPEAAAEASGRGRGRHRKARGGTGRVGEAEGGKEGRRR